MISFLRKTRRTLIDSLPAGQAGGSTPKFILYAIGEIALVVIGILIALQINNWNENIQKRETEQKVLLGLIENLELNVKALEWKLSSIETSNYSGNIIFSVLNNAEEDKDTLASHWHRAILNHGNMTFSEAGYQSLKDVGFQIISNETLRKEIVNLYEDTYLNLFRRLKWSEEVRPDFDKFIQENFIRKRGNGGGGMNPRDFNFIAHNDYYYGLLDVARSQRSFNKRSYIDVLSETNSVLQLIKNELGFQD